MHIRKLSLLVPLISNTYGEMQCIESDTRKITYRDPPPPYFFLMEHNPTPAAHCLRHSGIRFAPILTHRNQQIMKQRNYSNSSFYFLSPVSVFRPLYVPNNGENAVYSSPFLRCPRALTLKPQLSSVPCSHGCSNQNILQAVQRGGFPSYLS